MKSAGSPYFASPSHSYYGLPLEHARSKRGRTRLGHKPSSHPGHTHDGDPIIIFLTGANPVSDDRLVRSAAIISDSDSWFSSDSWIGAPSGDAFRASIIKDCKKAKC